MKGIRLSARTFCDIAKKFLERRMRP